MHSQIALRGLGEAADTLAAIVGGLRPGGKAAVVVSVALLVAGCGGGPPGAARTYVKERWPRGKILHCERTEQVAEAGRVWQCAVRRKNATGRYASDLNEIGDIVHPPLIVCLAVRGGDAIEVAC